MSWLRSAARLSTLLSIVVTLACGDQHSLQSVSVNPAIANSQAQFVATGIYNRAPTSADITTTATWCIGTADGICAGNIIVGGTGSSGAAQCLSGFSGTVTVLA